MKKDDLILVYYLDVSGLTGEEVFKFVHTFNEYLKENDFEGKGIRNIIIPIYNSTRVECLNPQIFDNKKLKEKTERYEKMLDEFLKSDDIFVPSRSGIDKFSINSETGEMNLLVKGSWFDKLINYFANAFGFESIKLIDEPDYQLLRQEDYYL